MAGECIKVNIMLDHDICQSIIYVTKEIRV